LFPIAQGEEVDVFERFWADYWLLRCWFVQKGRHVMIAAHGNTLRAMMKHLDNISEKDILELNIPTG